MGKKSNITHQALKELQKECHFGQSKYKAKEAARLAGENPATVKGIYSQATFNSYSKVAKHFIKDTIAHHREVKTLDDCKKYVPEFLERNQERGLSAWTLALQGSALGRMYHCSKNDFDFKYPSRNRADIIRSRGTNSSDYRYPEEKWDNARLIFKATGCRRMEALRLRKEDFRERDDGNLEVYKRGKGGIERWCLVNPNYTKEMKDYLEKTNTHSINGEERLLLKAEIPKGSVHDLRADYAKDLYDYFENRGDVATGNIYHCKKEKLGQSFDKGILKEVSHNLQHSRHNVVANNYLWK